MRLPFGGENQNLTAKSQSREKHLLVLLPDRAPLPNLAPDKMIFASSRLRGEI
jgi:hypothetical protein